jgi:hypothetical protein
LLIDMAQHLDPYQFYLAITSLQSCTIMALPKASFLA